MRKLLVPAIAAAILATSAVAFAATKNTTGTVKAFDSKSLTLANGNQYMLPQGFMDPGIKAGEKVTVAWEYQGRQQDRPPVREDRLLRQHTRRPARAAGRADLRLCL